MEEKRDLIGYIRDERKKGVSLDIIRKMLLETGISYYEIERSIKIIEGEKPSIFKKVLLTITNPHDLFNFVRQEETKFTSKYFFFLKTWIFLFFEIFLVYGFIKKIELAELFSPIIIGLLGFPGTYEKYAYIPIIFFSILLLFVTFVLLSIIFLLGSEIFRISQRIVKSGDSYRRCYKSFIYGSTPFMLVFAPLTISFLLGSISLTIFCIILGLFLIWAILLIIYENSSEGGWLRQIVAMIIFIFICSFIITLIIICFLWLNNNYLHIEAFDSQAFWDKIGYKQLGVIE